MPEGQRNIILPPTLFKEVVFCAQSIPPSILQARLREGSNDFKEADQLRSAGAEQTAEYVMHLLHVIAIAASFNTGIRVH